MVEPQTQQYATQSRGHEIDHAFRERLATYLDMMGNVLGTPQRRANFARYTLGLVGDGTRKSMEPIKARVRSRVVRDEIPQVRCGERKPAAMLVRHP